MEIQCTPYAMAYCYVTPDKATLFINTARVSAEAAAELKENGVEPVSYTHLDVYKRQAYPELLRLRRPQIGCGIGASGHRGGQGCGR